MISEVWRQTPPNFHTPGLLLRISWKKTRQEACKVPRDTGPKTKKKISIKNVEYAFVLIAENIKKSNSIHISDPITFADNFFLILMKFILFKKNYPFPSAILKKKVSIDNITFQLMIFEHDWPLRKLSLKNEQVFEV